MPIINAAQSSVKTISDPNAEYDSLRKVWDRTRAVCQGERYVKDYDSLIDVITFNNLLIPFSPSMSQAQYNFYKAEAELPGITAQFARMLVGGLLRKCPTLTLPEGMKDSEVIHDWIMNEFGQDDSTLTAWLDVALWEEIQTSRGWVIVDYPTVPGGLTKEENYDYKPYPCLYKAESVINWRTRKNAHGKLVLDRLLIRGMSEDYDKDTNEFHPKYMDTIWVYELDEEDLYQIRIFKRNTETTNVPVIAGNIQVDTNKVQFELVETITDIQMHGERLDFIPAWPLNGSIPVMQPILSPIIDKEVSLYNKISRRNHLLYGAATYTPVLASDMGDDAFNEIVGGGLGTWVKIRQGDTLTALETPTAALQDMDRCIAASIEEMAKLGIRMLTPETDQSGVALEIRNAAQTAQMGSLNNKISNTMKQVICFMINWRFDMELESGDLDFSLSADFSPVPLGSDWLRLATEWFQQGLIPRSIWLGILKHNDMIPPDYDDEEGQAEIAGDLEKQVLNQANMEYAAATINNGGKPPPTEQEASGLEGV